MVAGPRGLPAALSGAATSLDRVQDPIARARAAGMMLEQLGSSMVEVAEIRRWAVTELVNAGMSYAAVGHALGITKSMVAKVHGETIRRMLPGGIAGFEGRVTGHV